ncbi:MAG TPA: PQQ-dependent sugar dehydrogenase [Longimicrobiales bacterium]|nr:PQQ-dependent sugar dehydrogenase [Longimicrobiales bacterium]
MLPEQPTPATRPTLAALPIALFAATLVGPAATPAAAQTTDDPYPEPIEAEAGVIVVGVAEFASVPDVGGEPARLMTLRPEPGTDRLFVSDMRGLIYRVSHDGSRVTEYLNVDEPEWDVRVEASGRERGIQSFAVHPQFHQEGAPGYGKLYTWVDTRNTDPEPDFPFVGDRVSHHTVLLEWTADDPGSDVYEGSPPRELARFEQPYGNHNGGDLTFNPLASPEEAEFGLLYVGVGDGGAGGDPHDVAENLSSGFGKILRIDPLGSGGRSGEYGIPGGNPFADDGEPESLAEIYAYGLRNPQHFAWDAATGRMFVADIGQNMVEEVSPVTPGADLGWNAWEASFGFVDRGAVRTSNRRGDPDVTYPVAEYDHADPLVGPRAAVTGLHVVRESGPPELDGLLLFGDLPSGEIFWVNADDLPDGGQSAVRRVLLDDGSGPRTFLELVQAKNREQGREPSQRTDLRLGEGADGRIFLLDKHDGTIRVLTGGGG